MCVHGEPFQPSAIFASKGRTYPSGAPVRSSLLWYPLGLIHKHQIRLERLALDEHSRHYEHSYLTDVKSFKTLAHDQFALIQTSLICQGDNIKNS